MLLLAGAPLSCVLAASPTAWQDDFRSRLEALALLQTLNSELLSHDSATRTLERWCAAHQLAAPARVVADLVRGADKAPTPELLQLLHASSPAEVRYRHVRLRCGAHILSEADNWYLPARLTPEMNQQLDTTDTPFGRAVQELRFQRHTLSATLLWAPLPDGWEMGTARLESHHASLPIPPQVLQHRALLSLPDGAPLSVVIETYSAEVLAFPKPPF
jgi:chorismate-pyruvate lyase